MKWRRSRKVCAWCSECGKDCVINDKTRILFELGEPKNHRDWPDYLLQYGFDEADVDTFFDPFIRVIDAGTEEEARHAAIGYA